MVPDLSDRQQTPRSHLQGSGQHWTSLCPNGTVSPRHRVVSNSCKVHIYDLQHGSSFIQSLSFSSHTSKSRQVFFPTRICFTFSMHVYRYLLLLLLYFDLAGRRRSLWSVVIWRKPGCFMRLAGVISSSGATKMPGIAVPVQLLLPTKLLMKNGRSMPTFWSRSQNVQQIFFASLPLMSTKIFISCISVI